MIKKCSKCEKVKFLDDFYRSKKGKDGRMSWCTKCFLEHNRKVYWALGNLQLLPAVENLSKNDRIDAPFQPSLAFGGTYA